MSRIDYGNELLCGIPEKHLDRLQRLQNSAARLISGQTKCDHITETLRDLHWLPIRSRIKFKILIWTFKAVHGQAPPYIRDLIIVKNKSRKTRSCSNGVSLEQLRSNLKYGGDRCFRVVAPKLWNSLPLALRDCSNILSFRKHLKTHLFLLSILVKLK